MDRIVESEDMGELYRFYERYTQHIKAESRKRR